MRPFGKRDYVVLSFCLLVLFWSSAFTIIKVGLDYSPPLLFAGLRSLLGGAVMALAALFWGGPPNLGRDWPVFGLLALLNVVLFFGLQTYTVLHLPSGTAAVLIYLQPILTGFLAWLFLGEPLGAAKLFGLLLGFSGIVAVSAGGFTGSGDVTALGIAFGAASALAWSCGTVYFKRAQQRVSTLWAVAIPFLVGGALLTVLGAFFESVSEVSWTGPFVASLLYSGLVGTALAWGLWLGLVRAGEASRVAAYIFAVPLSAVLMGAIFLGESLSFTLLIGVALVVSGIYLVNRSPSEAKKPGGEEA